MYYTIYRITNSIDGKTYIGCHKTDNLDDGYMGSGVYLNRSIDKHGIENFHKEILEVFDTPEEMFYMESVLVNEDFVVRKDVYNLKEGGHGGFDFINKNCGNQGKRLNESLSQDKRSLGGKNSRLNDRIKVLREDPEFDRKFIENCGNSFRGKRHTEETKQKMRDSRKSQSVGEKNSQYGTMWITNEVESKKIKNDGEIPVGWRRGRKSSR